MERDGFYIGVPDLVKKTAESIANNVSAAFGTYFLDPGSPEQLEMLRGLIAQYAQCPLEWVKVVRGENGFDVSISPDVPMEDLSMEVTCET